MATNDDANSLNELYQKWLEIPADRLPPNHYALLGVEDFQSDRGLIEQAAKKRIAFLHEIAAGPQRKAVQHLLGQVALARRTLLDEQSKRQYDQSLREPKGAVHAGADLELRGTPGQSAKGVAQAKREPPAQRRSKDAGAWKYHAISASVLLLIVGVIWFVNRGGGGRRAADAKKRDDSPSQVQPNGAAKPVVAIPNRPDKETPANKKPQQPTRVVAPKASSAKQRETPARKRGAELNTKSGSGLLGGDGEMASFIAAMNSEGASAESDKIESDKTRKAPDSPTASKLRLPGRWRDAIGNINEFTGAVETKFDLQPSEKMFLTKKNQLVVVAGKKKTSSQRLKAKSATVAPSYIVSVGVQVSEDIKPTQEFGIVIGEIVVGAEPGEGQLTVFSQVVGKRNTRQVIQSVVLPKGPFSFSVFRPAVGDSSLRWIVDTKGPDHTGLVERIKLKKKEAYTIFFHAPPDLVNGSMRFLNLKAGKLESPPAWE